MPRFPVQNADLNIWGTLLRDFFSPYFDLNTGQMLSGVILNPNLGPGVVTPVNLQNTVISAPTGLSFTTGTSIVEGAQVVWLRGTWNANPEAEIVMYEWRIKEGVGGNYVYGMTGVPEQLWQPVKTNTTYYIGLRATDRVGNRSPWSADAFFTTAIDLVPPASPTTLVAQAAFRTVFLTWTNPPDGDMYRIDVYRNSVNNSATATKIRSASINSFYVDEGINTGTTYYYWIKAVDRSLNESAFSNVASATTARIGDIEGGGEIAPGTITPVHLAPDTTAPAAPSGLAASGAFRTIVLTWTPPADGDVDYTEIWRHTADDRASATRIGQAKASVYADSVATGSSYYYWIRARDFAGNLGAFNATAGVLGTTAQIASGDLLDGAVLQAKLADAAVITSKLANLAVDTTKLANLAVEASKLASGSVVAGKIAANAIVAGDGVIANAAIGTALIQDAAIQSAKIGDLQVLTGKIADLAVTTAKLNDLAVTNAKIADATIDNAKIANLSASKITAGTIAAAAVYLGQNQIELDGTNAVILVRDQQGSPVTRVRIGKLGAGQSDYGITIYDASGNLIVGNGGLGNNVVGSAQIINAAILNAAIANAAVDDAKIANVSAGKINAGDIATARLQVNAANAVNAGSVQITPGMIQVSGSTTLADWRYAGDTTQIDGGDIAANTIAVNKAFIGLRGVTFTGCEVSAQTPTANTLYWSAGIVEYIDDNGNHATAAISASSVLWSSGTVYLYWVKGATTLSTTTTAATAHGANNVVIASYRGGTDLVVNFGRTIIDGSDIVTGTITALGTVTTGILQNAAGTLKLDLINSLLTVNVAGGLRVQSANGITVVSGGNIKLESGGDLILTDDTSSQSGQLRFQRAADSGAYWKVYKYQQDVGNDVSNGLFVMPVGMSPVPNLYLGNTSKIPLLDCHVDKVVFRNASSPNGDSVLIDTTATTGNTAEDLRVIGSGKFRMISQGASPEGALTAVTGTLCHALASSVYRVWLKVTGSGNTGWARMLVAGQAEIVEGDLANDAVTQAKIADAAVGTLQLKTATGSATTTGTVLDVTMNDYSFFPSLTNTTTSEFSVQAIPSTADPSDTVGRFRVTRGSGTGVFTARWRYITSSDTPTIWVSHDQDGNIVAVWMSDDPLPNNKPGLLATEDQYTVIEVPRGDLEILLPIISSDALAIGSAKASSGDRVAYRALHEAFTNPAQELMARCVIKDGELALKGA